MLEFVLNGLVLYAVRRDPACTAPLPAVAPTLPAAGAGPEPTPTNASSRAGTRVKRDSILNIPSMPWLSEFVERERPLSHLEMRLSGCEPNRNTLDDDD